MVLSTKWMNRRWRSKAVLVMALAIQGSRVLYSVLQSASLLRVRIAAMAIWIARYTFTLCAVKSCQFSPPRRLAPCASAAHGTSIFLFCAP